MEGSYGMTTFLVDSIPVYTKSNDTQVVNLRQNDVPVRGTALTFRQLQNMEENTSRPSSPAKPSAARECAAQCAILSCCQ